MELDENYFKTQESTSINVTVESFLVEDENILWRGRAKKSAYIAGNSLQMAPFAILWACFDIFFLSIIFRSGAPAVILFFIVPFFALHLTPVWVWLHSMLKAAREQKTIEYVITNKRVIEFRGEPKYIYKAIYLDKMIDVNLKINLIDKLLGVGDITIYSDKNLIVTDIYSDNYKYFNKRNSKNIPEDELNKVLVISDITDSINLHAKLLKICHGNHDSTVSFAVPKVKCKNCGTAYESSKTRCPSCGSPNIKK